MNTQWRDLKRELMKNDEFAAEYEDLASEYELARSIIRLQLRRGLAQEQPAARIKRLRS